MNILEVIFCIIFIIVFTAIVIWSVYFLVNLCFSYNVPCINTRDSKVDALIDNLDLDSGDIFLDLGSWFGEVISRVSKNFPKSKIIWYEASILPYLVSVFKKSKNKLTYSVKRQDFFTTDFSEATVIFSYILPKFMPKIWEKIKKECKSGTMFYSNAFIIPGEKIYQTIHVEKGNIYVYKVK